MHLKNISMINTGKSWGLAPAYDLLNVSIINPGDDEELALTLNGKKRRLKKEDFEQLGETIGLNTKQIHGVFKRFAENKQVALDGIQNSFLSSEYKKRYMELLEQRYTLLF